MKNEKVKLPKEVAEVMEAINNNYQYPIRTVLDVIYSDRDGIYNTGARKVLNGFVESDRSRRIELIAKALVNGFEVEQTPEERIRRIYERAVIEHGEAGCQLDDYTTKILTREILNTLGIKIEGVNAE